jgi:hypothetical protein
MISSWDEFIIIIILEKWNCYKFKLILLNEYSMNCMSEHFLTDVLAHHVLDKIILDLLLMLHHIGNAHAVVYAVVIFTLHERLEPYDDARGVHDKLLVGGFDVSICIVPVVINV